MLILAPPTTITQSMLASALSATLSSSQSSSMNSLYRGPGASPQGGPSSLPTRSSTDDSGSTSLHVPPPASLSRLRSWPASSPSSLPEQHSSSGPQSHSSSHSTSSSGGVISQGMLQQALQSIQVTREDAVSDNAHVFLFQTQPSSLTVSQQAPPPLPPPRQPQSATTHRFQSQVYYCHYFDSLYCCTNFSQNGVIFKN